MFSFARAFLLLVTPLLSTAVYNFPNHKELARGISGKPSTTSTAASATTATAVIDPSECTTYYLTDVYMGAGFLAGWEFETFATGDPTHGRVNYVNESYALWKGLAEVEGTAFTMRVDDTTVLNPNGTGRDSVRIKSLKQYTEHLAVCVFSFILAQNTY